MEGLPVDCPNPAVTARLFFFFFQQKTAYEVHSGLEFRRVLFRSWYQPQGIRPLVDTQLEVRQPPARLVHFLGLSLRARILAFVVAVQDQNAPIAERMKKDPQYDVAQPIVVTHPELS